MPQITLTREQALRLLDFCTANGKSQFFVAKDQGAYIGQTTGAPPKPSCLFYFKGCDPKKDKNWYDTAHRLFGGDDFGEFLPVSWLQKVKDNLAVMSMTIKVGKRSVSAVFSKVEN